MARVSFLKLESCKSPGKNAQFNHGFTVKMVPTCRCSLEILMGQFEVEK